MKWLFLLLLIINIGIFSWGYRQEQLPPSPTITAGADIGEMRLIGERQEKSDQAATEAAPAPTQEESVPETEQTATDETPSAGSDSPAETAEGVTAPEQTEEAAASPEKQQISASDTPTQSDRPETGYNPSEPEAEMTSRCGAIGPILDRKKAQGVLDDLKKLQFAPKLEESTEKQQIGYWVVIPHLGDGDQAQSMIERLAQAGLKDIWHFRGGELENVISLGVFSQKDNAENFSREVLAKGFKTEMQPRFLNKKRYTVKFNVTRPKNVTGIMWRMVEKKYSRMPFTEQSCEPIATR
jgi:hypothetical protein